MPKHEKKLDDSQLESKQLGKDPICTQTEAKWVALISEKIDSDHDQLLLGILSLNSCLSRLFYIRVLKYA